MHVDPQLDALDRIGELVRAQDRAFLRGDLAEVKSLERAIIRLRETQGLPTYVF